MATPAPKRRGSCLLIVGLVILAAIIFSGVRYVLDMNEYNRAYAAYQHANCTAAILAYDNLLNSFRLLELGDFTTKAKAEREECVAFAVGSRSQQDGSIDGALTGYRDFMQTYPQSPLAAIARQEMYTMLTTAVPGELGGEAFCSEIEPLAAAAGLEADHAAWPTFYLECGNARSGEEAYGFYNTVLTDYAASPQFDTALQAVTGGLAGCEHLNDLLGNTAVSQRQEQISAYMLTCGENFETSGENGQAANIYARFLNLYPQHAQFEEIKEKYARALIANARDLGAGEIPIPNKVTGAEGGTTTKVIIQNDSPASLRLVMTGPETRIEEIPACDTCTNFTGAGPQFCPEQGPIGTYEVPTGTYEIIVESSEGSDTTPFTGTWALEPGEYYSCFFIVTTLQ